MNSTNTLLAPRRWWESPALRAFCLAFITAGAIFIPFMIFDRGYFLFYGDFNVQQLSLIHI